MKCQRSLFCTVSIVILLSLIFSLFGAQSPVQAGPQSLVSIAFTGTPYEGPPGQAITTTLTETFGDLSAEKNNVFTDILFTLPTNLNLAGVSVRALDSNNVQIGSVITLNTGQQYFWASAFGGALGRKSVRKVSLRSFTYHFVFTPTPLQAGMDIPIRAQAAIAKNGLLNTNPANWRPASSDQITANLRVFAGPFLSSSNIAGPYMTNVERSFLVQINNPANGTTYSNLHLEYQISNSGAVSPNITLLRYRTSTDNTTWSGYTNITPTSATGEFSPAGGYTLAPGQTEYIEVTITLNNDVNVFPVTLTLRNALGIAQDTLSSVMAVNPAKAELFSSDLQTDFHAGVTQEFHVTAVNQAVGGADYPGAYIRLTFPMDSTVIDGLEYFDGTSWQSMTLSGNNTTTAMYGPFHLGNTTNLATTVKFRVNFNQPGTYTVLVDLLRNSSPNSAIADTLSRSVNVIPAKPSLDLSDLSSNSPLTEGIEQPFVVMLNNPPTGIAYTSLNLGLSFSGVSAGDITSLQYSLNGGTTWQAVPVASGPGGTVVGNITPPNWSIGTNAARTINFRLTIAHPAADVLLTMKVNNQMTLLVEQSVYFDVDSVAATENPEYYLPIVLH